MVKTIAAAPKTRSIKTKTFSNELHVLGMLICFLNLTNKTEMPVNAAANNFKYQTFFLTFKLYMIISVNNNHLMHYGNCNKLG